jgi:hypothetical protein
MFNESKTTGREVDVTGLMANMHTETGKSPHGLLV